MMHHVVWKLIVVIQTGMTNVKLGVFCGNHVHKWNFARMIHNAQQWVKGAAKLQLVHKPNQTNSSIDLCHKPAESHTDTKTPIGGR